MNIKNVKELAEIITQHNLTSLEITDGDTKIKLEKTATQVTANVASSVPVAPVMESPVAIAPQPKVEEGVNFTNLKEVKSPIVGVFYAAPSPDSAPFVTIGSKVKKDDVLCIVEAMKLMNDITCECDGEIVDICVKNGDVVEYGQVLFKIF